MAVMQKFRDRFRRSSSSDVASICIPSLPSSDGMKNLEVRKLSSAESSWKPIIDKSSGRNSKIMIEPLGAIKIEDAEKVEEIKCDMLEKFEKQRTEILSLEEKLKDSLEKITERDEQITKLNIVIDEMKQERLQDEEVRYQRSILAKRQYTIDLENELEKVKSKIQQMNLVTEKRIQKAKEQLSKVKQDCALKIFEIKQENAKLTDDLAVMKSKLSRMEIQESKCAKNEQLADNFHPEPTQNTGLILQLSEQISNLDEENCKLKQELRELKKNMSKNQNQNR